MDKLECLTEYVHGMHRVEDVQFVQLTLYLRVCQLRLYSSWFIPEIYQCKILIHVMDDYTYQNMVWISQVS